MMLSVAKTIAGLWYQERRNGRNFEGKTREPNRGTIQTPDWRQENNIGNNRPYVVQPELGLYNCLYRQHIK